jgi:hypothetical protein
VKPWRSMRGVRHGGVPAPINATVPLPPRALSAFSGEGTCRPAVGCRAGSNERAGKIRQISKVCGVGLPNQFITPLDQVGPTGRPEPTSARQRRRSRMPA